MENKDLRLYIYDSGGLKKWWKPKRHKFKTLKDVNLYMESLQLKKYIVKDYQFILIEYYSLYKSKIIKLY